MCNIKYLFGAVTCNKYTPLTTESMKKMKMNQVNFLFLVLLFCEWKYHPRKYEKY